MDRSSDCCCSWYLSGGSTEGGTEGGDAGASVACAGAETGDADGFADGNAFRDPRCLPLPRGGAAATAGDSEGADCTCTGGAGGAGLAGACCGAAERGTAVSTVDPRGLSLPEGGAAATAGNGDSVDRACAGGVGGVGLAGACCGAAERATAVSTVDPRGLPLP